MTVPVREIKQAVTHSGHGAIRAHVTQSHDDKSLRAISGDRQSNGRPPDEREVFGQRLCIKDKRVAIVFALVQWELRRDLP